MSDNPEPTTIRQHLNRAAGAIAAGKYLVADHHVEAALALIDNAEHENYGDPYGWCRLVPDPASAP